MVIYAEEAGFLLKQPSEGIIADQVEEDLDEDEAVDEPQKGLFCSVCRYFITGSDKKIVVNGSHLHAFANPQGIIFEIGIFSKAPGCGHIGLPTDKWSWFSGFSWQIVICRSCLTHLGWVYISGDSVANFYGLIMERLVSN